MHMSDLEVYKKLKSLRRARGLTLNDLADNVGLDYQQISRIERGKSRLTIDVLMRMAKALDTPVEKLVHSSSKSEVPEAAPKATSEALTKILVGIEALESEMKAKFSAIQKGTLASHIYAQVNHSGEVDETIKFSLNLLRAAMSKPLS